MNAAADSLPFAPVPRLSDRNAARFLRLPADRQMRFLRDLKFPRGSPQAFKQPFYAPALNGIRDVVRRGFPGLVAARAKLGSVTQETRRTNLTRVLDSFVSSPHAARKLRLATAHRYYAQVRGLGLRHSPHLVAYEADELRYLYFHEKRWECDPEEARLTLELSQWILLQNSVDVAPHQIEVIDLFSGKLYSGVRMREETLKTLDDMACLIENAWPHLEQP